MSSGLTRRTIAKLLGAGLATVTTLSGTSSTVDDDSHTSDDTVDSEASNSNSDGEGGQQSGETLTPPLQLPGGDGPLTIARTADGTIETNTHDTIQGAIDSLPTHGELDSPGGVVFVPSKGGYTDEAYSETVRYHHEGGRLTGSGIHAKLTASHSEYTLKLESNDIELSGFWIDNHGSGDGIRSALENHLHNVNVDVAGRHGIWLEGPENWLGPGVEVKMAQTGGAVTVSGIRNKVHGVNVVQYYPDDTIRRGLNLEANAEDTIVSDCHVSIDGDAGTTHAVYLGADGASISNVHIEATTRYEAATGASEAAVTIIGNDVTARNMTEDGTSATGLFVRDSQGADIHGQFPSGVTVGPNVSGLRVWGQWSDVTEATPGALDGTYWNGVGVAIPGAGESPTADDWQALDRVVNNDDGSVWQLLPDGTSWTQLGPSQ